MADVAQILDTARIVGGRLLRLDIKGLRRVAAVNTLFSPENIVENFTNMGALFF